MAEYRKVEYRIGKDGKIIETVLNGNGQNCIETTAEIEKALGKVESQELLPDYYPDDENMVTESQQSIQGF